MSTNFDEIMFPNKISDQGLTIHPPLWQRRFTDILACIRAHWYFRSAEKIGVRVRLWGKPVIHNHGQIIIGNQVQLLSTVSTLEIATGVDGILEIGDKSYINHGCSIGATKLVRIGPNCTLGPQVMLIDNDFHRLEPERRHERPHSRPIILEENVWIGARAIVLRGITIGEGSVIGCGSVVTKDIPPRSLAVGTPARVIRRL